MSAQRLVLLTAGLVALLLVVASVWLAFPHFTAVKATPEAYSEGNAP